jgi:ABC-type multidrug transport system fused ATPase/permease subunit
MPGTIQRLLTQFCRQHWVILSLAVGASVMSHGIYILWLPRFLAQILHHETPTLPLIIMAYFSGMFFEKVMYMISNHQSVMIEPILTAHLTDQLITAAITQYQVIGRTVDITILLERIGTIRVTLEDLMYYVFFKLVPLSFITIITIGKLFYLDRQLGCWVLSLTFGVFGTIYLRNRIPTIGPECDALNSKIEDTFNHLEFIASSEAGPVTAINAIRHQTYQLQQLKAMMIRKSTISQALGYFASMVAYGLAVSWLYQLYASSTITFEAFGTHLLVLGKFFEIIFNIAYNVPIHIRSLGILQKADQFVSELWNITDVRPETTSIASTSTEGLEFHQLSFQYGTHAIFNQFTYRIPPGALIAFYGPSGSGKTTLMQLILQRLMPATGQITFNGTRLDQLTRAQLQRVITVVHQNTHSLLTGSIWFNIEFGYTLTAEQSITLREICDRCQLATIFATPDFLQLPVEKGGRNLSGGQKQIIHLLHAFVNQAAQVIILDEPTSALDAMTRDRVLQLITELHRMGKTVIIITHDLTIRNFCPTVLTFQYGHNPMG